MAVKGSGGFLSQDASSLPTGDLTVMFWFRPLGAAAGNATIWGANSFDSLTYLNGSTLAVSGNLKVELETGDGSNFGDFAGTTTLSPGNTKWYHAVLRRTGTLVEYLLSDEAGATLDLNVEQSQSIANGDPWFDINLPNLGSYSRTSVKIWTAALTDDEIRIERERYRVCRTSDLWANNRLEVHTDLTDSSGNDHHYNSGSASGLATVAGPTIADLACVSTPAMPEPGSLVDHSEPCCEAVPGSSTPNAGPVLPQIGSGWTPRLAGGGTAATGAEIVEDEDWSVLPKEPDSWLEIEEEPYPAVSPSDAGVIKWGLKPYSDRGRLVEARLVEVGPIERGSSSRDGSYAPARVRLVAVDDDGTLRTRLADSRKRHLINREARYPVLSYAGRKADLTPIPAIQGRIVDVQTPLDRRAVIELQDIVGSASGILNPEKQIGLPVGDEHENLPDASRGRIYNILLGEHSDFGAVDAEGNDADIGMIPVVDCGDTEFEASPGSGPIVMVSAPRNLTGTLVGSGSGSRTYHYGIVGVTEFGHTLMSNIVSVSGCPDSLDVDTYVELEWDPPLTGPDFIIAYWVMGRSASTPNKRLDTMNNGGTYVNPETTYRDGRQGSRTDFDREKSVNFKPIATAPASSSVWTWFAAAVGNVPILDVYGSDINESGVPKRVRLDINGGDILTPESDDWPEPEPYRVVGGIPQSGFWARGTRVQHHRDGIVSFAVNTGGLFGLNGEVIDQAFPMLLTLLNEFVEKDGLLGGDGAIGAIATFADGTPKFWTSKFEAAQEKTIEFLGGSPSKGFIGAIGICEPTPLAEIIRRFFVTFGGFLTSDGHGRIYPYMVDPAPAAGEGLAFRERMEIAELLEHRLAPEEFENRGKYSYHYNHETKAFRALDEPFEDATSIEANGGGLIGVVEAPAPYECHYGNDAETMSYRWGTLHLALYAGQIRYVRWSTDMTKFQVNNGAEVRFTHRKEGLGETGDADTPGVIQQTRLLVDVTGRRYAVEHLVRLLEAGSP